MIHHNELLNSGIIEVSFPLPPEVITLLQHENWPELDRYFLQAEKPGGLLYQFMESYLDFTSIEHIIAIRSAPGDEDGIWHDDGSRILGFSLSLTQNHQQVAGGELRFRKKGDQEFLALSTRPIGQILIFQTGIYGFEHMVSAVTAGRRVVIAGWCS